jgi:hypothetical protein
MSRGYSIGPADAVGGVRRGGRVAPASSSAVQTPLVAHQRAPTPLAAKAFGLGCSTADGVQRLSQRAGGISHQAGFGCTEQNYGSYVVTA